MNLVAATYRILFNNKNVTTDVSDYLLSLSYTDKVAGEADELELQFHDRDGLWQNEWWPERGGRITAFIELAGIELSCGSFVIDEVEYGSDRSGDIFSIKSQAASLTKALRTNKNTAHENKTLKELVNSVAKNHGLKVKGEIENITIGRSSQNRESDLQFLQRLASLYGYTFSVRDDLLIFTSSLDLQTQKHVLTIDKTELTSFKFMQTSKETFKEVTVNYHNPVKNELVAYTVKREEILKKLDEKFKVGIPSLTEQMQSNSELLRAQNEYQIKVENQQQAEAVAKTIMLKSVTNETQISGSCPGNPLLVSGVNIQITGAGRFSGFYHITESSHSLEKGEGYATSFEAMKVGDNPKSKHHPKKKSK